MEDDFHYTSDDLLALAERCEAGARDLERVADNAVEVLATRACGDQMDPQQWAATKRNAAQAATQYAAALRAEAATDPAARIDPGRYAQAERVAQAAQLGGILIDGRRQAERRAQSDSIYAENDREIWAAGTHPAQVKAAEIEATGQFAHVGDEAVPFWRLGGNVDEQARARRAEHVDDDGDEA